MFLITHSQEQGVAQLIFLCRALAEVTPMDWPRLGWTVTSWSVSGGWSGVTEYRVCLSVSMTA